MVIDDFWLDIITVENINVFFLGNSQLIARSDVARFLDYVACQKINLLGAEGFIFDGEARTPLMECIIDYSNGEPSKSVEFHRQIIIHEPDWQVPHFIEFVFNPKVILSGRDNKDRHR